MNTYSKYCPNVFVAKCTEKHEKGESIKVTTKYGKENDCIVFNLVAESGGFYYYSIVRADGFNRQTWLQRKAEKMQAASRNAEKKALHFHKESEKHRDFLCLGEPIKVGHHSERMHRKIIEDARRNFGNYIQLSEKAKGYQNKAANYDKMSDVIDLSMPESLDFYEYKLAKAMQRHKGLKEGTIPKEHSYSLTYAKKEVNELQKKLDIAKKLWGDVE
jgi:hypothetical protein